MYGAASCPAESIVDAGNALMMGLGEPAVATRDWAGHVAVCDVSTFTPSTLEEQTHPTDPVTPAVLRIVGVNVGEGRPVVLLGRRNFIPWRIGNQRPEIKNPRSLDGFL